MKKLLTMVAVATVLATPAFARTRNHQTSTEAAMTAHYSGQRPTDPRASSPTGMEGDVGVQGPEASREWVPPTPSPY